jgi:hypothetical protein
MADVISRLNAALSGRHVVESEIGAGGMATVYSLPPAELLQLLQRPGPVVAQKP